MAPHLSTGTEDPDRLKTQRSGPPKILLHDDGREQTRILKELLEALPELRSRGVVVHVTTKPEEFKACLADNYDIVVTDFHCPKGADGMKNIRSIAKMTTPPRLMIVFSGRPQPDDTILITGQKPTVHWIGKSHGLPTVLSLIVTASLCIPPSATPADRVPVGAASSAEEQYVQEPTPLTIARPLAEKPRVTPDVVGRAPREESPLGPMSQPMVPEIIREMFRMPFAPLTILMVAIFFFSMIVLALWVSVGFTIVHPIIAPIGIVGSLGILLTFA